jgi:hypothetical protein
MSHRMRRVPVAALAMLLACAVAPSTVAHAQPAGCPTITIEPASFPGATAGAPYRLELVASGGSSPYAFTESGILPVGITLDTTGVLAGMPSPDLDPTTGLPVVGGIYPLTVTATDADGCDGTLDVTLSVAPAGGTAPSSTTSEPSSTTSSSPARSTTTTAAPPPGSAAPETTSATAAVEDDARPTALVAGITVALALAGAAVVFVVLRRRRPG